MVATAVVGGGGYGDDYDRTMTMIYRCPEFVCLKSCHPEY